MKTLRIILGAWRYLFGFCPACNSDAPRIYDCSVCEHNRIGNNAWWSRFLNQL